jgi:hypothetical protein
VPVTSASQDVPQVGLSAAHRVQQAPRHAMGLIDSVMKGQLASSMGHLPLGQVPVSPNANYSRELIALRSPHRCSSYFPSFEKLQCYINPPRCPCLAPREIAPVLLLARTYLYSCSVKAVSSFRREGVFTSISRQSRAIMASRRRTSTGRTRAVPQGTANKGYLGGLVCDSFSGGRYIAE